MHVILLELVPLYTSRQHLLVHQKSQTADNSTSLQGSDPTYFIDSSFQCLIPCNWYIYLHESTLCG